MRPLPFSTEVTVLQFSLRVGEGLQDRFRREVTAHAVDSTAWRGRRGTQEDGRIRGRIRVEPQRGAREELEEVLAPAVDVAADVVRVVGLELSRPHGVATDDPLPEARGE